MAKKSRSVTKLVDQANRGIKRAQKTSSKHVSRFLVKRWGYLRSSRKWVAAWLVLVGFLILASAAQFFWFQGDYQTISPEDGGTYVEGTYGDIDTLNPLFASTRSEKAVQALAFSSLYQYDSHGSLQPELATDVSLSKDAKRFTVKLRKDVLWQDSQTFTAKDVIFTVNLIKNKQVGALLQNTFEAVSVRAIDDYTVEFSLSTPYSMFQHALTFAILPEHLLKNVEPSLIRESEFSYRPVGTGPFEVKLLQNIDAENGEKIVHLVANPDYYAGEPKLNRYEVHSYGSREAIVEALRDAEINATTDIIDIDEVDDSKYSVEHVPVSNGAFALFNTGSNILKDRDVRRALQVGTNTEALTDTLGDSVRPMSLPFLKSTLGKQAKNIGPPAYNVKKAKAILDKAGWKVPKNGSVRVKKDQKLELRVVLQAGKHHNVAADTLKSQWAQLGVDAQIVQVDPSNKLASFSQDYLRPRQYDVLIYNLLLGSDLDTYPYWHSSQAQSDGLNFSDYDSVVSDEAIISVRLATNPELRRAKARAFANRWISDAPAIALYQETIPYIHSQSIRSYGSTSRLVSANDQYSTVVDWHMKQRSVYKTP